MPPKSDSDKQGERTNQIANGRGRRGERWDGVREDGGEYRLKSVVIGQGQTSKHPIQRLFPLRLRLRLRRWRRRWRYPLRHLSTRFQFALGRESCLGSQENKAIVQSNETRGETGDCSAPRLKSWRGEQNERKRKCCVLFS